MMKALLRQRLPPEERSDSAPEPEEGGEGEEEGDADGEGDDSVVDS